MSSLYPQLRITDSNFNYTSAAKTDIRETFKKARESLGGQDSNKPLVPPRGQSLNKPLVEPTLNPGGFVLPAEWFEILE
jgi:hypothetical protein